MIDEEKVLLTKIVRLAFKRLHSEMGHSFTDSYFSKVGELDEYNER